MIYQSVNLENKATTFRLDWFYSGGKDESLSFLARKESTSTLVSTVYLTSPRIRISGFSDRYMRHFRFSVTFPTMINDQQFMSEAVGNAVLKFHTSRQLIFFQKFLAWFSALMIYDRENKWHGLLTAVIYVRNISAIILEQLCQNLTLVGERVYRCHYLVVNNAFLFII